MRSQLTLFGGQRLQMTDSIELTVQSLLAYGPTHPHWAMAYSGGKDSSTLVTLVVHLLETGRVPQPQTLSVFYADTRMELVPLAYAARSILLDLRDRGIDVREVLPPLDKRYFVYMLGRGVPPPNNNTFRWCTRQIKVDPMEAALREKVTDLGGKALMLTGVRQGESAIRDGRIAMSCGRNGAECGQGWFQETLPTSLCDTLAPLLHWRVCHVWEWLRHWAPRPEFGDWSTEAIADAYGGEEAEEINARTGCIGCPLAQRDTALDTIIANPRWSYLAPLKGLRPLYRVLREKGYRLRKPAGERRKDGTLSPNQCRMGPLTIEARMMGLDRVLEIQAQCNAGAREQGRPLVDILNAEEEARIRELIAANTWPNKWDGTESRADQPYREESSQAELWLEEFIGGAA